MAILKKLLAASMPWGLANALEADIGNALVATGTSQTDALPIAYGVARFGTVASGTGGILPANSVGDSVLVINAGANALSVYPPSGHSINSLAADAAYSVPVGGMVTIKRVTNTLWLGTTGDSAAQVFLQSGSGAIATTVAKRLDLEVHLWDFLSASERADMGTASVDVSTAVATAIAAFGSNGGTLIVDGYFGLGAAGIAITSKTGIVIEGRGPKAGFKCLAVSTTTVANNGVSWLRMTSSTRCGFRNLYIDNDSKANNVIAGSSNTDCFVEGCNIFNGGLNASIMFVGGTGNRFVRNTVKDSAANSRGLWIGNLNASELETDVLIEGNYVNNTGYTGIGGSMVRATIVGNRVVGSAGAGIVLSATTTLRSSRCTITGNVCKGNSFHGIQVGDPANAGDYIEFISVVGNVCETNNQDGIYVTGARDCAITGNNCANNAQSGGTAGITVAVGKRIAITGNVCADSASGASRTQNVGIYLTAASAALDIEDVSVSANLCRNNKLYGIYIVNSGSGTMDTVSITGNLCVDNNTYGIVAVPVSQGDLANLSLVGNTCIGNGTDDIRVNENSALIENNKFSTEAGLTVSFASTDTTPSVLGRSKFQTANASGTVITAFDDGVEDQEIFVLINDANTTIDFTGTTLKGNGGADWTPTTGDSMQCVKIGSNWYCRISDNTA